MDIQEIEALYRCHGAVVLRRARGILGDEHAARDAMQEVFLRLMGEHATFRGSASPRTWLYRITTNHCLNVIRDTGRRQRLLDEKVAPTAQYVPLQSSSGSQQAEGRAGLAMILRRVPEELRAVAVCFYLDEMTQTEAAEYLGVSRRTVGYRLQAFRDAVQGLTGQGDAPKTAANTETPTADRAARPGRVTDS